MAQAPTLVLIKKTI